jgi:colicin import membrane protein
MRRDLRQAEKMQTYIRSIVLGAGVLALSVTPALAQDKPAAPAKAADAAAKPAPAPAADKAAAPASGASREDLLAELKKANEQLAADKKAAADAAKGTDKEAAKAAKEKVKADGKAINDINQKLHALKVNKAAAKTDKGAAAAPAK